MQSSSLPTLFTIRKILCHQCPATRSIEDLEHIYSFLTSQTEIESDPLWIFLPRVLRLELCAYFNYVRLDENQLIHIDASNDRHAAAKLYLLVRGEGDLLYGDFTIPLNAKHGPRFGGIYLPRRIQCLVRRCNTNKNLPATSRGIYEAFLQRVHTTAGSLREGIDRTRQIMVSLQKGSHYIYFSATECRNYMNRLFDRIVYHWVFHRLYIKSVKNKKYGPCRFNLFMLPKGHPLFVEGSTSDMIVLILRGKCRLKKRIAREKSGDVVGIEDTTLAWGDETVYVGFADPLSLLGFHPHVCVAEEEKGEGLCGIAKKMNQPYTVVAETRIHAAVFEPRCFMNWIGGVPGMANALHKLAWRQLRWLNETLPQRFKERHDELGRKEEEEIELEANSNNSEQSSVVIDDFPTSTCVDMEEIINSRELKKKACLSNKHKLLKGLKRLIVQDEEDENADWVEYEDMEDPFSRFDFIDTSMYNLQNEILLDDFTRNKDDNCIDANMDMIDDETFSSKVRNSLIPHPSILLSRKSFGKTLPAVQQSQGFLNPYDVYTGRVEWRKGR